MASSRNYAISRWRPVGAPCLGISETETVLTDEGATRSRYRRRPPQNYFPKLAVWLYLLGIPQQRLGEFIRSLKCTRRPVLQCRRIRLLQLFLGVEACICRNWNSRLYFSMRSFISLASICRPLIGYSTGYSTINRMRRLSPRQGSPSHAGKSIERLAFIYHLHLLRCNIVQH